MAFDFQSATSSPLANNNSLYQSLTIQNVASMVSVKLKYDNYLLWRSFFIHVLCRYKLCWKHWDLSSFTSLSSSASAPNLAYEAWLQKIKAWLTGLIPLFLKIYFPTQLELIPLSIYGLFWKNVSLVLHAHMFLSSSIACKLFRKVVSLWLIICNL